MSLTDAFVKEIEKRILTGEWKIGDRIPPLRELAGTFKVSRSVVNAGLVVLQNNGFIVTYPRRYSAVADWKRRGTFAVLDGLVNYKLYDTEFFSNLLDSRMVFECASARFAAEKRTEDDLKDLLEVIREEERAVTIDERTLADVKFHHTVAVASHNIVFPLILKSFEDMVIKFVTFFYQNNFDREFVYRHHNIIYGAIKDNNPDLAESAMQTLLKQGEDVVKKIYTE